MAATKFLWVVMILIFNILMAEEQRNQEDYETSFIFSTFFLQLWLEEIFSVY